MLDYNDVIKTLDQSKIKQLAKDCRYFGGIMEKAVWEAIDIANVLKLDKCRNKTVLDIGCGAGWFLYVCKLLGHKSIGIDKIDYSDSGHHSACTQAYKMFGYAVYDRLVYPLKPINLDNNKFDIIVSNRSFFPTRPTVWKKEEWQFLFKDIKDNLIKSNDIQIFFSLNSGEKRQPYVNMLPNKRSKWGPTELEAYFHNYDYTKKYKSLNVKRKRVNGNIIHIKDISSLITLAQGE